MMWSFFVLMMAVSSFAKVAKIELAHQKKVTITHPDGWEVAKDLYGLPLVILGPYQNESRPVLSVLPTHLKKEQQSPEDFQKLFSGLKNEKTAWIDSHKGKLLKYEDVKAIDLRQDLKGHYIGAEYAINRIHFIERSYYLYCKGEIYNLKYSIRNEHLKHVQDLQKIIGDFRCE